MQQDDGDPDADTGNSGPRDSTDIVGPFARIRVIVALICIAVALAVLAWRMIL